jgi:hypothetical protein
MVKQYFCNRPGARFVFCEVRFSYPTGKQAVNRSLRRDCGPATVDPFVIDTHTRNM